MTSAAAAVSHVILHNQAFVRRFDLSIETMALVAKKGSTSPIYGNFGDLDRMSGKPRDTTEVVCKICSCVICARQADSFYLIRILTLHASTLQRNMFKI